MNRLLKSLVFTLSVVSFVGCDQATKIVAKNMLSDAPTISYCNDVVQLHYAENTGSFLGLGADLPQEVRSIIHLVTSAVIIAGMILLVIHIEQLGRMMLTGFALLMAGACGNLLDRFFNNGRVIDFVVIGLGNLRTGIFNFADILIMAGVGLLLLSSRRWKAGTP